MLRRSHHHHACLLSQRRQHRWTLYLEKYTKGGQEWLHSPASTSPRTAPSSGRAGRSVQNRRTQAIPAVFENGLRIDGLVQIQAVHTAVSQPRGASPNPFIEIRPSLPWVYVVLGLRQPLLLVSLVRKRLRSQGCSKSSV